MRMQHRNDVVLRSSLKFSVDEMDLRDATHGTAAVELPTPAKRPEQRGGIELAGGGAGREG
jgi:hypothetical protein